MKDYTVLLRSVASTITGADLLYTAKASLITKSRPTVSVVAHNKAVCTLVARLLHLSDDSPEVMEQVLLSLPERE